MTVHAPTTAQPILDAAPSGSILDLVARAWAVGDVALIPTRATVRIGGHSLIPVAIDNGNDGLKGATLSPADTLDAAGTYTRSRLTTVRIPTAFAVAQTIQGHQEISYTIEGVSFWTGESALIHRGDSLRLGPTIQRLDDERQRWFIGAGIVELLRTAGYAPGEYTIALTLAVPNTEIVIERDAQGIEQLTLDSRTRESLVRHMKGRVWTISRDDNDRHPEEWKIKVGQILPQAQSTGSMLALTRSPNGKPVLDLTGLTVIDIGGGDLHVCDVGFNPAQMKNERPGDGTIRIARALRSMPPVNVSVKNDAEAQQALISRRIIRSGRFVSIDQEVQQAVSNKGNSIVADVLSQLRDSTKFVVVTGGGVLLLREMLEEVLLHDSKKPGQDYVIIDGPLASLTNAIGTLFGMIFLASGKR